MSRIIVSYRRSDSTAIAGRIFDRLVDRYGEESVFMDIDKIPFGTDFRHHIQNVLRGANLLLAVVGPNWLGSTPDGRSRIRDEADPVRVEVETALKQGMTVIPILIGNAVMPAAADLPESLRDFAYINAAPIDDGRDFRQHMDRLIRSIDGLLNVRKTFAPADANVGTSRQRTGALSIRSRIVWTFIGIAIVLLIAGDRQFGLQNYFKKTQEFPDDWILPPQSVQKDSQTTKNGPNLPDDIIWPEPAKPAPKPPAATYRVLPNVSGGVQNLRRGPAVKYPIVAAIPAGATGIALGACRPAEDNTRPWCVATWQTHSGWISSCCIVDEKTGAPPRID